MGCVAAGGPTRASGAIDSRGVLAWILTLPAATLLSAGLYLFGHLAVGP